VDVEIALGSVGSSEAFFRFLQNVQSHFRGIHSLDHYPEDVNARAPHPSIPAEALARQARLRAALLEMEQVRPNLEPTCMQALRAALAGRSAQNPESMIAAILAEDLVEEATELLRSSRREAQDRALIEALLSRLMPLSAKAQARRSALWQLDARRVMIRMSYVKQEGALGFDDGDIHTIFLHAFRWEGLSLVLDLGKRPRPLLSVGVALPAEVGGWAETMDAMLKREPTEEPASLMTRLNRRLPDGLRIHRWDALPGYASAVGDLALAAHWRWNTTLERRLQLEGKVSAFLDASRWPWDRGTSKSDVPLDLRTLITKMAWDGDALRFSTRMGAFQAINPLKMLGALLDLDPAALAGLVRTGVDLKSDARVDQADRFEPKLKNMYEDAVLLGGGSNIVLVDEDDDEPIHLGPQSETR
jgi:radical SAM-linked protein